MTNTWIRTDYPQAVIKQECRVAGQNALAGIADEVAYAVIEQACHCECYRCPAAEGAKQEFQCTP